MFTGLANQPQIKGKIVYGAYLQAKQLTRRNQVPHVSARVILVYKTGAVGVQRREIVGPFPVAHVHHPVAGKNHAVAAVAGGHHTVHHIHTPVNGFENICRRADAHQIARFVGRQNLVHHLNHLIHHLGRLTHCQSANGIAVGIQLGYTAGASRRKSLYVQPCTIGNQLW